MILLGWYICTIAGLIATGALLSLWKPTPGLRQLDDGIRIVDFGRHAGLRADTPDGRVLLLYRDFNECLIRYEDSDDPVPDRVATRLRFEYQRRCAAGGP